MQPETIIFIGPQGSGKGTQIEKLKKVLEVKDHRRVVDIQTGRRFRELAVKQETFTEHKLAATLNMGSLQPNFLSTVLWGQAMVDQLDDTCHLLIDGFPRNLAQIPDLEDACVFFERKTITVVNLETPEEIVRGRMVARSRADDTSQSIEARLLGYKEETLAVLEYYKTRQNARVIDIKRRQDLIMNCIN